MRIRQRSPPGNYPGMNYDQSLSGKRGRIDLRSVLWRAVVERNISIGPGVELAICGRRRSPDGGNRVSMFVVRRSAGRTARGRGWGVTRRRASRCPSSEAAHFAAQGVMAGAYDVVIAAGVESMTRVPMGVTAELGPGLPFGPQVMERYANGLVPQGISAEMIADKWGLSREELDLISLQSHQRAARATDEGRFQSQIQPVTVTVGGQREVMTEDEGIRRTTSTEALASLPPAFKADGKITAGNSSQISDGSAAVLIMSEERASQLDLTPMARFVSFALAGVDPVMMLTVLFRQRPRHWDGRSDHGEIGCSR